MNRELMTTSMVSTYWLRCSTIIHQLLAVVDVFVMMIIVLILRALMLTEAR